METKVQFKSSLQVSEGLWGLKFMEGGSYISDWLVLVSGHMYSSSTIPHKVADLILHSIGLDADKFGNKDFVRFTNEHDVSGMDDRELICFLYRHDFRWQLYTLH